MRGRTSPLPSRGPAGRGAGQVREGLGVGRMPARGEEGNPPPAPPFRRPRQITPASRREGSQVARVDISPPFARTCGERRGVRWEGAGWGRMPARGRQEGNPPLAPPFRPPRPITPASRREGSRAVRVDISPPFARTCGERRESGEGGVGGGLDARAWWTGGETHPLPLPFGRRGQLHLPRGGRGGRVVSAGRHVTGGRMSERFTNRARG